MDNNPLSILRAQVEAATAGSWLLGDNEIYTEAGATVVNAIDPAAIANAALIVTAVAIVRRMVSDEAIEQAARAIGMRGIRQIVDHTGETIDETWDDFPDEHRAQCRDLALAALASLLTGGV